MLQKIVEKLSRLGVTRGLTFHLEHEDGVGMLIVPNPTLTQVNLNTVPAVPPRRTLPAASGDWKAKPLRVTW